MKSKCHQCQNLSLENNLLCAKCNESFEMLQELGLSASGFLASRKVVKKEVYQDIFTKEKEEIF